MPVFLLGANVAGKADFATVAWAGTVCSVPPLIAVSLRPTRYSYRGIKETANFSINMPSVLHVVETDFCGLVSGAKVDKVAVCGFHIFYGKLQTAPLIEECPVNLECCLSRIEPLGSHDLVIGEVASCYVAYDCVVDGHPDISRIKPFIYRGGTANDYVSFGEVIGLAYKAGRVLKRPASISKRKLSSDKNIDKFRRGKEKLA
jgi:flavin reductase (DIM6/NTAB) family NADH-FMN oxidoreductase RutF